MSLAITNGKIVTPLRIIDDGVVLIDNCRIQDYGSKARVSIPEGAKTVDAEGQLIAPGFIDIHCHGGGGHRFMEEPEPPLITHVKAGTTRLLAATDYRMTADDFAESVGKIRNLPQNVYRKALLGLFVEGPPINPQYGAQSYLSKRPSMAEYRSMLEVGGDLIKTWMLAPEMEESAELAEILHDAGVILSVGHSEASAEQVLGLVPIGLRIVRETANQHGQGLRRRIP